MKIFSLILEGSKEKVLCEEGELQGLLNATGTWVILKQACVQREKVIGIVFDSHLPNPLSDDFTGIVERPHEPYKGGGPVQQIPAFTRRKPGQAPARMMTK